MQNSHFHYRVPNVLHWMEIWWLQGPSEYSEAVFKITFWDHLSFCDRMRCPAARIHQKMLHCGHKQMDVVCSDAQVFKWCQVCRENSHKKPEALKLNGSMFSNPTIKMSRKTLRLFRPQRVSNFLLCKFGVSAANCILLFLFLDVRGDNHSVDSWLLYGPSFSKFDGFCAQRWSSARLQR